ncbi:MAG: NAD/NADP octopine/nopaline dehydrogenase family protein [Burkholderiales bacterium]|nr:NAD/NADP octopine/nopaline dehydrogenase family protein [Burkholderiales bacterium]
MKRIERVAIIGAGNGGCAAAVDLTLRGFDVRLYGRTPGTLAPLKAREGIEYEGIFGEGMAKIPVITNDAAEAMHGADAVVAMAPAQAHEDIATLIAPHLTRDQAFLAAPGHTLTLIPRTLRRNGHANPVTCVTSTLPYICRKTGEGRVRVSRASARLRFAAFPAIRTQELAERLRSLFPAIFPVPTVLDTLFPYTNAIHHPPALLCNVGRVESTGGEYCHYYDGITPSVGTLIDRLDDERVAVARAHGCTIDRLPEHFFQMGYTDENGRAGGTAYSTFHNSEPNRWIKAPSSIDHRFFNEDIPFGLVPFSELARVAGVATPVIDAVVLLASTIMGRPYRDTGLNVARMGFEGLDAAQVRRLVEHGYA